MSLLPDGAASGPFQKIEVPTHIVGEILTASKKPSAVVNLGRRVFLPYGDSAQISVHDGEAQYVGPGQAKAGSQLKAEIMEFHTNWFQKTIRLDNQDYEKWRAHAKDFLRPMIASMLEALPRALDFAVFHGIDARSGISVDKLNPAIHDSTVRVDAAGLPVYDAIDQGVAAIYADGGVANGIALDAVFASRAAAEQARLTQADVTLAAQDRDDSAEVEAWQDEP